MSNDLTEIKIYPHGHISLWEGKLGAVYPMGIDYDELSRMYDVFFIDNGKGKPLKKGDFPELEGQSYDSYGNNNIGIRVFGRHYSGRFLSPQQFSIDIQSLKELSKDEGRKYIASRPELIDVTYEKISQKNWWSILNKCKNFDDIYDKLGSLVGNKAYDFITRNINEDEDKGLRSMKGVYAMTKDGHIKFIVEKEK